MISEGLRHSANERSSLGVEAVVNQRRSGTPAKQQQVTEIVGSSTRSWGGVHSPPKIASQT
jgi:hypothetical protein